MSSLVRVGSDFGYFDLESSRISSGSGSDRIGFRSLLGSDRVWISLTFCKKSDKIKFKFGRIRWIFHIGSYFVTSNTVIYQYMRDAHALRLSEQN
jgi:hypothetical protein